MRRGEARTAIYLYCLVQGRAAPSLGQAPPGLPGLGKPRALPAGGSIWIIAADAPRSRYGPEQIARGLRDLQWVAERAVAHEAVVEFFAGAATTIPMKVFTLFSSDDRARAHIWRRRVDIERAFRRIAGREEWGLRVRFEPPRGPAGRGGDLGDRPASHGAGTRYLLGKKAEGDRLGGALRRARAEAGRLFHGLTRHAEAARRRAPPPGEGRAAILLEAAFLVDRRRASRFRRFAERARARLAGGGCHLTLTGPWPPYNFVRGRP